LSANCFIDRGANCNTISITEYAKVDEVKEHDMPVSARLDEETKAILDKTAKVLRTTKTEVLKKSIREFCGRVLDEKAKRPYELIRDLIGEEKSGRGDLSVRGEEILRERFGRKR
jgi:predicted transcriptional regulator